MEIEGVRGDVSSILYVIDWVCKQNQNIAKRLLIQIFSGGTNEILPEAKHQVITISDSLNHFCQNTFFKIPQFVSHKLSVSD